MSAGEPRDTPDARALDPDRFEPKGECPPLTQECLEDTVERLGKSVQRLEGELRHSERAHRECDARWTKSRDEAMKELARTQAERDLALEAVARVRSKCASMARGIGYRVSGHHETWDSYHEGASDFAAEIEDIIDGVLPSDEDVEKGLERG